MKNLDIAITEISKKLKKTEINILEEIYLSLAFTIEKESFDDIKNEEIHFRKLIISKFSQELLAIIGCLKYGSLYGVSHHIRSLIEISAILEHIFSNQNDTDKLLYKFNNFHFINAYNFHQKCKNDLQSGKMGKTDFDIFENIISHYFQFFNKEKFLKWIKTWEINSEKNFYKIKYWHFPIPIDSLLEKLIYKDKRIKNIYESHCHSVHVSPMGIKNSGINLILQPSNKDLNELENLIKSAYFLSFDIIRKFIDFLNLDSLHVCFSLILKTKNFSEELKKAFNSQAPSI
jgi:hypothetical protein